MSHFGYLVMLLFTIVGSFWLEIYLKVGVLKRFKIAFISIAPVAILFILWDFYAVTKGHWRFDSKQSTTKHNGK